jgi:hypothetical protein
VVVVVADGDGEDLLGLVLLDDEAVEVVADLARLEVEGADAAERFDGFVVGLWRRFGRSAGVGWGGGWAAIIWRTEAWTCGSLRSSWTLRSSSSRGFFGPSLLMG